MQSADIKLENLSYIILYVKDMVKSTEFYRDILGVELKVASPGWVEFKTGSTTLALHQSDSVQTVPAKGGPEVCFTVSDVDGAYAALKARSVNFFMEPHVVSSGEKVDYVAANFRDLDGNHLSIYGVVPKG